jgi:hypothetical protein
MSAKKKPDAAALVNELRGASAFFQRDQASATAVAERAPAAEGAGPGESIVRPSVRPSGRRSLRRHPFEFYQDQIDTLKRLSLEDQLAGGQGSMSAMVREAVDLYISNRTNQEDASVRPSVRMREE